MVTSDLKRKSAMNKNAELFEAMLKNNKITAFRPAEEVQDEYHSVIYRTLLDVKGKLLQTLVIFDDTPYVVIRCFLEPKAVNDGNRVAVERELTRLNGENKVVKYYVSPAEDVAASACIPYLLMSNAANDMSNATSTFDPNIVRLILDVFMNALPEAYERIMKAVYGGGMTNNEVKEVQQAAEAEQAPEAAN